MSHAPSLKERPPSSGSIRGFRSLRGLPESPSPELLRQAQHITFGRKSPVQTEPRRLSLPPSSKENEDLEADPEKPKRELFYGTRVEISDEELINHSGDLLRAATKELRECYDKFSDTKEHYSTLCRLVRRLHEQARCEAAGRGAVRTNTIAALVNIALVSESAVLHAEALQTITSLCENPICGPAAYVHKGLWKALFTKASQVIRISSGAGYAATRCIATMGKGSPGAFIVVDCGGMQLLDAITSHSFALLEASEAARQDEVVIADACNAVCNVATSLGHRALNSHEDMMGVGLEICLQALESARFACRHACRGVNALVCIGTPLDVDQMERLLEALEPVVKGLNWSHKIVETREEETDLRAPLILVERLIDTVGPKSEFMIKLTALHESATQPDDPSSPEPEPSPGSPPVTEISEPPPLHALAPPLPLHEVAPEPLPMLVPHSVEYIHNLESNADCRTLSWGALRHLHNSTGPPEALWRADTTVVQRQTAAEKRWATRPRGRKIVVYNRASNVKAPLGKDTGETASSRAPAEALVFDSRFESGNLCKAVLVSPTEYDLTLSPDTNSSRHKQWFYFRVSNITPQTEYTFNIINFEKPSSLFNEGQRPLLYTSGSQNKAWVRCGRNICYFKRNYCFSSCGDYLQWAKRKPTFILTFTVKFESASSHYLAYCFPYTMLDLRSDLVRWLSDRDRNKLLQHYLLGNTIGKVDQDMLVIADPTAKHTTDTPVIVLSGRVHPGETNSSYVMRGLVDWLTDPTDPAALMLRKQYRIMVVPMLNPDGVICGNYRCSLPGRDMNRQWRNDAEEDSELFYEGEANEPPVLRLKHLMSQQNVVLYCDLHGHSRMLDACMYGNTVDESETVPHRGSLLPYLLSLITPVFSFEKSTFKSGKNKEGTGRVVAYRELGIMDSFTLECSLAGSSKGRVHFGINDLEKLGSNLGLAIADWHRVTTNPAQLEEHCEKIEELLTRIQAGGHHEFEHIEEQPQTRRLSVLSARSATSMSELENEPESEHEDEAGEEEEWEHGDDESGSEEEDPAELWAGVQRAVGQWRTASSKEMQMAEIGCFETPEHSEEELVVMKKAATRMQAMYRGHMGRNKIASLLSEMQEEETMRRYDAMLKLQEAMRREVNSSLKTGAEERDAAQHKELRAQRHEQWARQREEDMERQLQRAEWSRQRAEILEKARRTEEDFKARKRAAWAKRRAEDAEQARQQSEAMMMRRAEEKRVHQEQTQQQQEDLREQLKCMDRDERMQRGDEHVRTFDRRRSSSFTGVVVLADTEVTSEPGRHPFVMTPDLLLSGAKKRRSKHGRKSRRKSWEWTNEYVSQASSLPVTVTREKPKTATDVTTAPTLTTVQPILAASRSVPVRSTGMQARSITMCAKRRTSTNRTGKRLSVETKTPKEGAQPEPEPKEPEPPVLNTARRTSLPEIYFQNDQKAELQKNSQLIASPTNFNATQPLFNGTQSMPANLHAGTRMSMPASNHSSAIPKPAFSPFGGPPLRFADGGAAGRGQMVSLREARNRRHTMLRAHHDLLSPASPKYK